MNRRKLLAGIGGVVAGGTAGCAGILGGSSSDCTAPDKDLKRMLPNETGGFERSPGNLTGNEIGVQSATAIYTKDNARYFVSVVEFRNESAARNKGDLEDTRQRGFLGRKTIYVIVENYSFIAYSANSQGDYSETEMLLKASALNSSCVDANARRP